MKHAYAMPFGASLEPGGGVTFRLWAPDAEAVELVIASGPGEGAAAMEPQAGWLVPAAPA